MNNFPNGINIWQLVYNIDQPRNSQIPCFVQSNENFEDVVIYGNILTNYGNYDQITNYI